VTGASPLQDKNKSRLLKPYKLQNYINSSYISDWFGYLCNRTVTTRLKVAILRWRKNVTTTLKQITLFAKLLLLGGDTISNRIDILAGQFQKHN
tara:strand:+ start:339 stop:620 length:282 start_codon:yes stop_codon:yes gene_type:complete